MNLYRNIDTWLKDNYAPLNNWLYFNATPSIIGTVSMNSVPGDNVYNQFINGAKQRRLIFAIDMVLSHDDMGTSDTNLLALDEVENLREWLREQQENKNFPDFGEYNKIEKMELLTSVPTLLVDTTNGLGKYQFQARIEYKDESEVLGNG